MKKRIRVLYMFPPSSVLILFFFLFVSLLIMEDYSIGAQEYFDEEWRVCNFQDARETEG